MSEIDISKSESKKIAIMYILSLGFIVPSIYLFVMLTILDNNKPITIASYFNYVDTATVYITYGLLLLFLGLIFLIIGIGYTSHSKLENNGSDAIIRSRYIDNKTKNEAFDDCINKYNFKENKCKKSIKKIYGEYIENE